MPINATERTFLEEFLSCAPNRREKTPKTLENCLIRKWIEPCGSTEDGYPKYETTALGRRQLGT